MTQTVTETIEDGEIVDVVTETITETFEDGETVDEVTEIVTESTPAEGGDTIGGDEM